MFPFFSVCYRGVYSEGSALKKDKKVITSACQPAYRSTADIIPESLINNITHTASNAWQAARTEKVSEYLWLHSVAKRKMD